MPAAQNNDGDETVPAPYILRPAGTPISGAGLFVKYVVDGALELAILNKADPDGHFRADPVSTLRDRHTHFARYCAHRQLSVDVFDGASRLPIGTTSIPLQVRAGVFVSAIISVRSP